MSKRGLTLALSAAAALAGSAAAAVWLTGGFATALEVTQYTLQSAKLTGPVRLAVIADLHSCWYGKDQKLLVEALEAAKPDVLLYAGDIFDDRGSHDNALALLKAIQGVYPAYYVTGNHEHYTRQADQVKQLMRDHGVTVLEGGCEQLTVEEQTITVCGVNDPAAGRNADFSAQLAQAAQHDKSTFSVLLSHRPERIRQYLPHGFDLVVSGHAHGGQWRLPKLLEQGLVAPNQGLFPRLTGGLRRYADTTHIISRGLALESTPIVPRIYNRPELVIVTAEPVNP